MYTGIGQLQLPSQLRDLLLQTTTVGGLLVVRPEAQGAAMAAMQTLGGFVPAPGSAPDPLMGSVALGPTGKWIDAFVAQGKAVLVDVKGLSAGGTLAVAITADPGTLAGLATPGQGFAVLASDQNLLGQAQGLAAAPKCPSGQYYSAERSQCIDATTGQPPEPGVPTWVFAAGAVGVALLGLSLLARRRQPPLAA